MSIITRFLSAVTEPKFKLARDLTAMASHTEKIEDEEQDRVRLQQNLIRAAETFMENKILIKAFQQGGIDFAMIVKQEALLCFSRHQL